MRQPQVVPADWRRHVQIARVDDAFGDEAFAQPLVLAHRKAVLLGERQDEGVGIERFHGTLAA